MQEERLKTVNKENFDLKQKIDSTAKDLNKKIEEREVLKSEIDVLKYKVETHTKALKETASATKDLNTKIEEREKELANAGTENTVCSKVSTGAS